ncbi:MAG: GAF domain-containing sensor histidine kinase [Chloroflexi bacterium]|nr:GAF domain-containing sensor histidine kinase [Chloroflexota bacterium]
MSADTNTTAETRGSENTLDAVARLDDSNRRLRALLEFGRDLRAQMDVQPIVSLLASHAMEGSTARGALVALYDAGLREVGRVATAGLPTAFASAWRQAARGANDGEGTEVSLAHTGSPGNTWVVFDGQGDPRLQRVRHLMEPLGLASEVVIALEARGECQGILVAYFARPEDARADEVASLVAMADEAAVAIHNARLYAQSRREVRRRDALRRVVESISSELDLDSLLHRVVESAVELLEANGGSITLFDGDGVTARMRAVHNLPSSLVGQTLAPGQGITGLVFQTGAPVVVADYSQDLPGPLPSLEFLHASIAVPIWRQGRLVGGFAVFDRQPSRMFDDDDRQAMELLANHVAIALENARLYAETQDHVHQLVGLQKLSAVILEEHDFDTVLRGICEQLLALTDATGVGLGLLEEQGRYVEMRTVVGPSAKLLRGARIPLEGSFAGEALRTNQPQRSADVTHDPRGYRPSLRIGGTRTILSVPMKTRQRSVGVLSIYNKRGGASFSERDAELASLFAYQAAVAIENARLYEQTREFVVVEERNRLARELHDSVTQSLFSVTLLSQTALALWDRDSAKARERLERAVELANGALAEMRALIFELRPMSLQEEGLILALRKHAAAVTNREGLAVSIRVDGQERRLPAGTEQAAFRIVQESLNNVVKHARATRATVVVTFLPTRLQIRTTDDGSGFAPSTLVGKARSLGMSSMRERAEEVGGTLLVESAPGRGTTVVVDVPIPPADTDV